MEVLRNTSGQLRCTRTVFGAANMDKSAFENAKRWARGSGTQDLKDFEDLLNMFVFFVASA